jgi:glycosyltransferase involved in cell wall biosynthesis
VPYITTCHGYFRKRLRSVIDTWGERVIAISRPVTDHLEKDLGVRRERIALVYSGVDTKKFSAVKAGESAARKKALGIAEDCLVAGNIGRLSPVKGQEFFLRAMAAVLPKAGKALALVIGSGPDEIRLKTLASRLGIEKRVRFIAADPDTPKFLAAMDVFVFPSVKEGLGIGLLEAMACARPCVASRIGGIEDIIEPGENGILVDAGSAGAIAGAVLRLFADPALRLRLGLAAQKTVTGRFTAEKMSDGILKVYGKVLAER